MLIASCNKPPSKVTTERAAGYVIGKEICHENSADDRYLMDATFYPNYEQIGDTLTMNTIVYTNVIKVRIADSLVRAQLLPLVIDYDIILTVASQAPCEVQNPTTYPVKEVLPTAIGYAR